MNKLRLRGPIRPSNANGVTVNANAPLAVLVKGTLGARAIAVVIKGTGTGTFGFASPLTKPSPDGSAVYNNSDELMTNDTPTANAINGAQGVTYLFRPTNGLPYPYPSIQIAFLNDATQKTGVFIDAYVLAEDLDLPHDMTFRVPAAA